MSPQQKASIRDAVVGGAITLLGSIALMLATGAWASKENASDHRADIAAVRSEVRRVLDVVCLDHPAAPQCQNASGVP